MKEPPDIALARLFLWLPRSVGWTPRFLGLEAASELCMFNLLKSSMGRWFPEADTGREDVERDLESPTLGLMESFDGGFGNS